MLYRAHWHVKEAEMGNSLQDFEVCEAVDEFLVTRPYHPCCLLVHRDIDVLEKVAQLLQRQHVKSVPVGAELSAALMEIPPAERAGVASATLQDIVKRWQAGHILFTDIDLLFEPTLALDPLSLLRSLSRLATLFVLWPGTFADGSLTYGTPEHAHYRAWSHPDLCLRCIIAL